ncbi:DUF7832 domain-containing protein [Thorsellia kenyensis]|uniref:DUF7832 domain-containing protein n=1 Tax=Thorsellia kenyensis TaxID=1549888 RepID=A0ABV6CAZ0_9GAMM
MVIDCIDWHEEPAYEFELEYKNAGTHIGMFISWLIINDLVSDWMKEDFADEIKLVLNRQMTGLELLLVAEGILREDYISEDALPFVEAYYSNDIDFSRSYQNDYEKILTNNLTSFYHVADSWENYELLAPALEEAYQIWAEKSSDS